MLLQCHQHRVLSLFTRGFATACLLSNKQLIVHQKALKCLHTLFDLEVRVWLVGRGVSRVKCFVHKEQCQPVSEGCRWTVVVGMCVVRRILRCCQHVMAAGADTQSCCCVCAACTPPFCQQRTRNTAQPQHILPESTRDGAQRSR